MTTSKLIWNSIKISTKELDISKVLKCGQAFRWKLNEDGIWCCSFDKIIFLKQREDRLEYSSLPHDDNLVEFIKDYFNLNIKIENLYNEWNLKDPIFAKNSSNFNGIRILRQDPWENLISFICSSNNNIKRISSMCDSLCLNFGEFVGNHEGVDYYSFPTAEILAKEDVEEKLRDLSFGYRAKYIQKTANQILDLKVDLNELREKPYKECHEQLIVFNGVGPKVADCVCLMSLDKHDSIPVDTHVYQIAKRDYKLKSKGDSVNKQTYDLVREFFVKKWGPFAGWAQCVMFTADLKDFAKEVKVTEVKKEIKIEVKEEIEIEIKEEEIEYSITGRPKRKKIKV